MRKAKWVKIGDEWHLMVTAATVKLQGRYALYEVLPGRTSLRVNGRDYMEIAIRKCEKDVIEGYSNPGDLDDIFKLAISQMNKEKDGYIAVEVIGGKPYQS